MQILQLLSSPLFLFTFSLFLWLAVKSFKTWRKIKEEVFIHFTFIFVSVSILALIVLVGLFFITFPGQIDKSILFYLGIVYDLLYLELSFLYLSLFSNSANFFEKYIPVFITTAFLLNFVAGYSQIEPYIEIAILFHAVVIILGLFIFYRIRYHFKITLKYTTISKEIDLLNQLQKIMLFILITFAIDGIGFLIMHYWVKFGFVVDEWLVIYLIVILLIIVALIYYIVLSLRKKAKNIDLMHFMNNLS